MTIEVKRAAAVIRAVALYAEVLGEPDLPLRDLERAARALLNDIDALLEVTK